MNMVSVKYYAVKNCPNKTLPDKLNTLVYQSIHNFSWKMQELYDDEQIDQLHKYTSRSMSTLNPLVLSSRQFVNSSLTQWSSDDCWFETILLKVNWLWGVSSNQKYTDLRKTAKVKHFTGKSLVCVLQSKNERLGLHLEETVEAHSRTRQKSTGLSR